MRRILIFTSFNAKNIAEAKKQFCTRYGLSTDQVKATYEGEK